MLVDREVERQALGDVLEDAVQGRPGTLVLLGEAGAGTSRLLTEAGEVAARLGARVVQVGALEPDQELPGAACSLVVSALADVVDGLDPAVAATLRATLRGVADGMLPGAVLELLGAAAESAPLVLLGDDVQWWDPPSLEALVFAARRMAADSVAVLLAGRPSVGDLPALHGTRRLAVGPLPREAAVAVVRLHLPDVLPSVAGELVDRLGGNPAALLDVAAQLPERVRTGLAPVPDPVPVGRALSARWTWALEALPAATRTALAVLAADGSGDESLVHAAWLRLGCSSEDLLAAEAAHVVELDPHGWRFPSPVVRAAVFAALDPPERRAAHGALAEVLASAGREGLYARHLAASRVGPHEDTAAELARLSDVLAEAGSFATAAATAEQAARLTPPGDAHVDRLLRAAELLLLAHDDERAGELAEQGLLLSSGTSTAAGFRRVLGVAVGHQRDTRRGVELLREAATGLDDDGRRRALVDALAFVKMWNDSAASLELIDELGDLDLLEPWMRLDVGHVLAAAGAWADAVPLLESGLRDVDPAAPGVGEAVAAAWSDAAALVGLDAYDDRYRDVAARLRDSGSALRSATGSAMEVELAYADGRWADAERICAHLRELDEALGRFPQFAAGTELRIAARRGDRETFERLEDQLHHAASASGLVLLTANALGLRALLHVSLGELDAAEPLLRRTVDAAPPGLPTTTIFPTAAVTLAALLARDGRQQEAAELAEPLLERLLVQPSPLAHAYAERLLAHTRPDDEVEQHFLAAEQRSSAGRHAFEAARTLLEHAQWLRRRRRRSDAVDRLVPALQAFEQMGCGAWADVCREELHAAGVDTARLDPYSSLATLTAQERQVAEAAAEGLTNAEIARRMYLSPKTVELHLTHVYRKLGVRGRSELVDVRERATAIR